MADLQLVGELNAGIQMTGTLNNVSQLSGQLNNVSLVYDGIIGKPEINGVVLIGDKTTSDLKISHEDILNNDALDLHPISAITGLQDQLDTKDTVTSVNEKLTNLSNELEAKIVTATNTYVFIQSIPSSVWEINHNLNKVPSVTVVDSAGSIVMGEINYIDMNNITITFSGAFSGKALLN